jgi:shikimate 5-dehydrogenase
MTYQDGKWQGHHIFYRAVLAALDKTLRAGKPAEGGRTHEGPLGGKVILFVGTNGLCRVLATAAQQSGAIVIIAGSNQWDAQTMAQALGCQFVPEEAISTTAHDVLLRCDDTDLHPGFLKPGMTVVDATALPRSSSLLAEAAQRGCQVVAPQKLLVEMVNRYLRAIAGETVPGEFLLEVLHPLLEE